MSAAVRPLIVVAFAHPNNDLHENLSALLDKGQQSCAFDVLYLNNVSANDIRKTLEKEDVSSRLSILYYAVTFNPESMVLNDENSSYLPLSFFEGSRERYPQLQCLFFEGLSADEDAKKLVNHAPLIINISNKNVHTGLFSLYFFAHLLERNSLRDAYTQASGKSANHEPSSAATLFVKAPSESALNFKIQAAKATHLSKTQRVVMESLPDIPFPGNRAYREDEAPIFCGRKFLVRDLVNELENPAGESIILLSGAKGVGKTSLMQAGLRPALLQKGAHVISVNKSAEMPLENLIRRAGGSEQTETLADLETALGSATYLFPDNAEDWVLNPEKGEERIRELSNILSNEARRGKIFISCRDTEAPALRERLEEYSLNVRTVKLSALNKREITQLTADFMQDDLLRERYGIRMEKRLPELISKELSEVPEVERHATLQEALLRMWRQAKTQNAERPEWTAALFKNLNREGISMTNFPDQQLDEIRTHLPHVTDSGLAADILSHYYNRNTGESHPIPDEIIFQRYSHIDREEFTEILRELTEKSLLEFDPELPDARYIPGRELVQSLIRSADESRKPAQVARRILHAKLTASEEYDINELTILSKPEIAFIEQHRNHISLLSEDEEHLIKESLRRQKKTKTRKRGTGSFVTLLLLVVITGVWWGYWQYREYENKLGTLSTEKRELKANFLSYISENLREEDPTKAVRVAEEACRSHPTGMAKGALLSSFLGKNLFYAASVESHITPVSLAMLSPDGSRVLSISEDGQAKLSSIDGELTADLQIGEDAVRSAVFSADGRTLYTGLAGGMIKKWDSEAKLSNEFKAHDGAVSVLDFMEESGQLVSGSSDGSVKVWNTENAEAVHTLEGHTSSVQKIVVSPSEDLIASVSEKGVIAVWDAELGQLQTNYRGRMIEFSEDETEALVIRSDEAGIWDLESDMPVESYSGIITASYTSETHEVFTLKESNEAVIENYLTFSDRSLGDEGLTVTRAGLSPEKDKVFLVSSENEVFIFETETEKLIGTARVNNTLTNDPYFSADGNRLVTVSGKDVHIWDCRQKSDFDFRYNNLSFSKGEMLTASYGSGEVQIWDKDGNLRDTLFSDKQVQFVEFLNQKALIHFADSSQLLRSSNADGTADTVSIPREASVIRREFSEEADFVLDELNDGKLKVYKPGTESHLLINAGKGVFLPGYDSLISWDDKGLTVWDLGNLNGDTVFSYTGNVQNVFPSADGNHLWVKRQDDYTLIDLKTRKEIIPSISGNSEQPILSKDNNYVLFKKAYEVPGNSDRYEFKLYDLRNGELKQVKFDNISDYLTNVSMSTDGRYIIVGDSSQTTLCTFSGTKVRSFKGAFVRYIPEQKMLLTESAGALNIYSADGKLMMSLAEDTYNVSSSGYWLIEKDAGNTRLYEMSVLGISKWLERRGVYRLTSSEKQQYLIDYTPSSESIPEEENSVNITGTLSKLWDSTTSFFTGLFK